MAKESTCGGIGLPESETEISLLGASNHGSSVGNLESNQLEAGAEMRRVEQSTADEVDLEARVEQHEQITGGPIR